MDYVAIYNNPLVTLTVVSQTYIYMEPSERDCRKLLQFHLRSQSDNWTHCIGRTGQKEGGVHYIKGRRKAKGKETTREQTTIKLYEKWNKGRKHSKAGRYYSNTSNYKNYNHKGQGKGENKGKSSTMNSSVQCHICKKSGHMATNCWRKSTTTTYATAAIGSGKSSQPQRFDLNHTTLDQPIACVPRDQRLTYNNRGQCISGSYVQSTTTPHSRAPTTTIYTYAVLENVASPAPSSL